MRGGVVLGTLGSYDLLSIISFRALQREMQVKSFHIKVKFPIGTLLRGIAGNCVKLRGINGIAKGCEVYPFYV